MENKIPEKFLPIGSVVLLSGGTKKAMITGYCSISEDEKEKVYDYTGCIYPEGYLDFDQICLFDHNQIEQVFHIGYIDDEEKQFVEELKEVMGKIESGEEDIRDYTMADTDVEDENDISLEENKDKTSSNVILPTVDLDKINDENTSSYEYL